MSISQSINIKFKVLYSREAIADILQRGRDNGFEYFGDLTLDWDYSKLYDLSSAVNVIYVENYTEELDLWPTVTVKYKDTGFTLYAFKTEEGYLRLDSAMFINRWKKESMIIGQDFDFAGYIKIWRQVVPHYPWLAVETEQE